MTERVSDGAQRQQVVGPHGGSCRLSQAFTDSLECRVVDVHRGLATIAVMAQVIRKDKVLRLRDDGPCSLAVLILQFSKDELVASGRWTRWKLPSAFLSSFHTSVLAWF